MHKRFIDWFRIGTKSVAIVDLEIGNRTQIEGNASLSATIRIEL